MAKFRLGFVLGTQAGLGELLQFANSVKNGFLSQKNNPNQAEQNTHIRLTENINQMTQISSLCKLMASKESISMTWSMLGTNDSFQLPTLLKMFQIPVEDNSHINFHEFCKVDHNIIFYIPLDLLRQKQIEQMARLSIVHQKVKHICLGMVPKWNGSQLAALKETWGWVDPTEQSQLVDLAKEIVGSLNKKDREAQSDINLDNINVKDQRTSPVIITESSIMKEVIALSDAVADTDSTILITGPSGVGKELIAQRIHCQSLRGEGRMVTINCGAIPKDLLESELFGHLKGSFTGAHQDKIGKFEQADKGTVFLDEIGDLSLALQVKLLRVLQEKQIEVVGSSETKEVDVRIVAATNKNLEKEVELGNFREDLFYRLNVIPIYVPALKERGGDIPVLVNHFIKKYNVEKSRRVTGITRNSLRYLCAYDWPGNIRELENLVERMVIIKSSGMIDVMEFPEKYRRQSLSEIEFNDLMTNAVRPNMPQQVMNSQIQQPQGMASYNNSYQQQYSASGQAMRMSPEVSNVNYNYQNYTKRGESTMNYNNNNNNNNNNNGGSHPSGSPHYKSMPIQRNANNSQPRYPNQAPVKPQQNYQQQNTTYPSYYQQRAPNPQPGTYDPNMGHHQQQQASQSISIEEVLQFIEERFQFPENGLDFNSVVDKFENILIMKALNRTRWNRNRAAGSLRLNRTTLVEKLKKKQLMPPPEFAHKAPRPRNNNV